MFSVAAVVPLFSVIADCVLCRSLYAPGMDALCNVLADPFAIEEVAEHTEMIELVVHIMQSNDWDEQVRGHVTPFLSHAVASTRASFTIFSCLSAHCSGPPRLYLPSPTPHLRVQLVERSIAMIMSLSHSASSVKLIVDSNGLQVHLCVDSQSLVFRQLCESTFPSFGCAGCLHV
jgi:hypothetical protein